MKVTKLQISKLVQEVTREILQEHLAQVVPNKQMGESGVNESDSEANPENEFVRWVKKAQPGLSSNDLAYDIAEEAFKAGFEEGVSWGRSYGADDVSRGYKSTGLRGDPQ